MIRDGFVEMWFCGCWGIVCAKVAIILRNATLIGANSHGNRLFFDDFIRKVMRVALCHDGIEPK
jgi:hypothetical protein